MLSDEWNSEREDRRTGQAAEAKGGAGRLPTFVIPREVAGSAADELFSDAEPGIEEGFWTPPGTGSRDL